MRRGEVRLDDLAVVDLDPRTIVELEIEDLDVLALAFPVVLVVEREFQVAGGRANAGFLEELADGRLAPGFAAVHVAAWQ